ncbi:unnamed protein product [Anisakis simplex]|uniref:Pyridoxamine 5'-phosphate oxidase n=1 Tax=Anisakis simplex TaxID=6269 RepID=A0A0M3K412_ANISI|nr:unnamed protein product [Anisakis simplex]
MLRSFVTDAELGQALALTSNSPYLLTTHYSIRHQLSGIFPESQCSVFGYPHQDPQLWMIIRRNKFTRTQVFMTSRTQLFVNEQDIDTFLMLAMPYLLELSEFAARILGIQLSKYSFNQSLTDADTVAGTWKFSTEGDRNQFAAKIQRMPSVCIKSYDGQLASFTVIEFGLYPIKFVEHENAAVLARSARSPWWSTVVDEAGMPVVQDHRVVYRIKTSPGIGDFPLTDGTA